jgi:hypothetical protein
VRLSKAFHVVSPYTQGSLLVNYSEDVCMYTLEQGGKGGMADTGTKGRWSGVGQISVVPILSPFRRRRIAKCLRETVRSTE